MWSQRGYVQTDSRALVLYALNSCARRNVPECSSPIVVDPTVKGRNTIDHVRGGDRVYIYIIYILIIIQVNEKICNLEGNIGIV